MKTLSTGPAKKYSYKVKYGNDLTEYYFIDPYEKHYQNMFTFIGIALALSAISSIALVIYIISLML